MADRHYELESELPPPGNRWGSGAQSVLPYLTKSLQARPSMAADLREQRGSDAMPPPLQPAARPAA